MHNHAYKRVYLYAAKVICDAFVLAVKGVGIRAVTDLPTLTSDGVPLLVSWLARACYQLPSWSRFLYKPATAVVQQTSKTTSKLNLLLQELRKEQTLVRLEDLKRDYTSFLYGFSALGPGAEPDDLSTDVPAIFEDDHLAYIFFR